MKIAIVGCRAKWFADPDLVRRRVHEHVATLPPDTIIVSGGEPTGVDSWAAEAARLAGLVLVEYPAQWRPGGGALDRAAGFKRNRLIVAQADEVHAFWDGRSPGTESTILLAQSAGKRVRVLLQDRAPVS